jgi:hypothetical protein
LNRASPQVELVRSSTHDITETQEMTREQMRRWRPSVKGDVYPPFEAVRPCTVRGKGDQSKLFYIYYDTAEMPFSEVGVFQELDVVRMNSTATLEYGGMHGVGPVYHVYVKCQIPGARQGQAEAWPLALRMVDRLTGTRDTREAVTHALGAARRMVKLLECENRPVVPRTPPASVGG